MINGDHPPLRLKLFSFCNFSCSFRTSSLTLSNCFACLAGALQSSTPYGGSIRTLSRTTIDLLCQRTGSLEYDIRRYSPRRKNYDKLVECCKETYVLSSIRNNLCPILLTPGGLISLSSFNLACLSFSFSAASSIARLGGDSSLDSTSYLEILERGII